MKILVVCQYYYPEPFRITDICEELVRYNHSVTVLTGLPNYPEGIVAKEYRFGKKRNETVNGVNVIRSFEIGRKRGVIWLGLNYISFMLSSSLKVLSLKKDFDIVFVYQLSPVTMTLPAIIYKKITKKPLFLYCCDIWPESVKTILKNENNFIFKFAKRFSKYIYSKCNLIAVTSKSFINYFVEQHLIAIDKIIYIPQHAEDIYLQTDSLPSDKKTVDFVFMGNIGIAQDIECILDAVEKIRLIENFKVHFVGDGSYLKKIRIIAKNKELTDIVIFHGRHSFEEMPKFYKLANACLLTLKDNNLTGNTIPSKLQGYMAAGKPVIGAINCDAQEVIREAGCGMCVNASDSTALSEAMKDFLENPEKFKNCGTNGRKYFEKNFTKKVFIDKIINEFMKLTEIQTDV